MTPFRFGAAVALLSCLAAGCDIQVSDKGMSFDITEGRASDEWVRTYPIAKGGRVEIVNVNGPIEVVAATGAAVEIRARREVKAESDERASALLAQLQMEEEITADRVRVATPGGRARRVQVRYHVALPAGLETTLKTQNGDVRIENVEGRLVASSVNGSVNTRNVSGAVDATTVNGSIQLDMSALAGDAQISTVNGSVHIALPLKAGAFVDARTTNGRVVVDERLTTGADKSDRRRFAGQINEGGPRISIQTTNGGVRVTPRD